MGRTPFDDLDESAVLTPQDVAERLRVDARSVRRAIARGELVASRPCGLRILAGDAAAWWRGRVVDAEPSPAAAPRRRTSRRFAKAPERLPLPPRSARS
jgi:hypothetical protein